MWIIVNTDKFREEATASLLREKFADVISDVYLPFFRKKYVDERGNERYRFQPLLYGFVFVKVDSLRKLRRYLTPWCYFMYEENVRNRQTGIVEPQVVFTKAHLLCHDVKQLNQNTIIERSTISNDDMERFIYYNERVADGIEGLSIVDRRYKDLILENDTIRILNGPLAGWVGVVKQVKHKGLKDRHLLVSFGNNHCLSISNIRKYDMCIEHEATMGAKSEEVGVWRAVDQLVGSMQACSPHDCAPLRLRRLIKDYNATPVLRRSAGASDVAFAKRQKTAEDAHRDGVLASIDASLHGNFRIIAGFFDSDSAGEDFALRSLVPDSPLRPFLTPAPGISIPDDSNYAVLRHDGLVELVIRQNLSHLFRSAEYDAGKYAPVFDEDYEYYAHIALLPTADGCVKAVCSWGGFYDHYAALTPAERDRFVDDLKAKKYFRLHSLLGRCILPPPEADLRFESVPIVPDGSSAASVSGFSISLAVDYDDTDIDRMARLAWMSLCNPADGCTPLSAITAAAVEMWQGTRLLVWRQLLQRYVLLHKVPVVDQPSVIPSDNALDSLFNSGDGRPLDIDAIVGAIADRRAAIDSMLDSGNVMSAACRFFTLAMTVADRFAKDSLYNFIGDAFDPDSTLTQTYESVIAALSTDSVSAATRRHVAVYIKKGMAELRETDAWKYFHFPTFLRCLPPQ